MVSIIFLRFHTAYSKMKDQDIIDLWTLGATKLGDTNKDHNCRDIRRNIGVWKSLYMSDEFVSGEQDRAAYLVRHLLVLEVSYEIF